MMLTPCWPSAGPTGGAGVAAPALIWSLMTAVNRFLGGMTSFFVTGWNGTAPVQGPGPSGARAGGHRGPCSDLGHLVERQLDRRLAAEDRDQNLQLLLLGVDLVDGGGQGGERAVHDRHRLTDLEVHNSDRRGGSPGCRLTTRGARGLRGRGRDEDLDDLVERQRRGTRGGTDEAGDAGGVADRAPGLVVELH